MCEVCSDQRRNDKCPGCRHGRGRGAFPFSRGHHPTGALVSHSFETMKDRIGDLIGFGILESLAFFLVPAAFGIVGFILSTIVGANSIFASTLSGLGTVAQVLMVGFITLGIYGYTFDALTQQEGEVFPAIKEQAVKIWKYAVVMLLLLAISAMLGFALSDWLPDIRHIRVIKVEEWIVNHAKTPALVSMIAAPIVIYVSLGFMFVIREIAYDDDKGPIEAIVSSWQLVSCNRWFLLGIVATAALANFIGAIPCGLGLMFSIPFGWVLFSAAYLALKTP